jgi:manganese/zinc/iron transport system substrate-binding protein
LYLCSLCQLKPIELRANYFDVRFVKSTITILLLITLVSLVNSCKFKPKEWQERYKVVATTGMIGDALENILPAQFSIHTLMGIGVDPHQYEAKPKDIDELALAETIVYNGLHLEGKMVGLFQKLEREKKVLAISDGLEEDRLINTNSFVHDPHIWLDPFLWADGIDELGKQLAKEYPEFENEIEINTRNYTAKIRKVGEWMKSEIDKIPFKQRVLITSHDAFHYFGKSFKVKVDALQGISTVSEPGIRTVSSLMDMISANNIPAVFIESSVAKKSIQALKEACERKGYILKEGGMLFSDAMGDKKQNAETYLKMLQRNTETLVGGLTN